jgi:hypothetical protein
MRESLSLEGDGCRGEDIRARGCHVRCALTLQWGKWLGDYEGFYV